MQSGQGNNKSGEDGGRATSTQGERTEDWRGGGANYKRG